MLYARPERVEGRPRRVGIRSVALVVVFALLLFVPAGTVHWPGAWVYLAILAVASVWGVARLERHDPDLLKERLRPIQRDQPLADKLLMGTFIPVWFGWFALMGLDPRFGWSNVPVSLELLGAVLVCLGIWLSWQALKENSYVAPMVKVHEERGLVSAGPYACVRHPMYSRVILFAAGVPSLLGSWWGLIVSALLIVVLAVRAVIEERALKAGFDGNADYADRVRYRFVPLLW
jgi:protein-S-isoprenylcysteine O-methyltransferase Ste14